MKRILVILFGFILLAINTLAQNPGGIEGDEGVNDVPVNGWVMWLWLIAVGYGMIKLYRTKLVK